MPATLCALRRVLTIAQIHCDDLTIVTDCETYITGFKLGAKIMVDVLIKGKVSKI